MSIKLTKNVVGLQFPELLHQGNPSHQIFGALSVHPHPVHHLIEKSNKSLHLKA